MTRNSLQKSKNNNINQNTSSVLFINLESIKANYNLLKRKTNKSEVAVAVKANAYGSGVKRICKTLITQGCNTFFVATAEEGLEVIKIKKNLKVYVLNGSSEKKSTISLIKNGVKIVINNSEQLKDLISASNKINIKAGCAVHVDTGMNRLGVDIEEAEKVVQLAKNNLNLSLIMSHLSCSENKASEMNNIQLIKFKSLKKKLIKFKGLKFSLANSNGILLGKKFHFDLCRPGGLIYGLNLRKLEKNNFRRVLSLRAKIIQIKHVNKGEFVGYGAKYKVKKKSVIATLGIGYADGLPRYFKGNVYYKNYKFPIIGNISMDLCTIDITSYKKLKVGCWVEIFGKSVSAERFADICGTISYEIACKIGKRVNRIYIDNFNEVNEFYK